MDYQRCKHRLTILYSLHFRESIWSYFSYHVTSTINISVDLASIFRAVEATLDPLTGKGVLLIASGANWQQVQVQ
jgi:hypothetical protein